MAGYDLTAGKGVLPGLLSVPAKHPPYPPQRLRDCRPTDCPRAKFRLALRCPSAFMGLSSTPGVQPRPALPLPRRLRLCPRCPSTTSGGYGAICNAPPFFIPGSVIGRRILTEL